MASLPSESDIYIEIRPWHAAVLPWLAALARKLRDVIVALARNMTAIAPGIWQLEFGHFSQLLLLGSQVTLIALGSFLRTFNPTVTVAVAFAIIAFLAYAAYQESATNNGR